VWYNKSLAVWVDVDLAITETFIQSAGEKGGSPKFAKFTLCVCPHFGVFTMSFYDDLKNDDNHEQTYFYPMFRRQKENRIEYTLQVTWIADEPDRKYANGDYKCKVKVLSDSRSYCKLVGKELDWFIRRTLKNAYMTSEFYKTELLTNLVFTLIAYPNQKDKSLCFEIKDFKLANPEPVISQTQTIPATIAPTVVPSVPPAAIVAPEPITEPVKKPEPMLKMERKMTLPSELEAIRQKFENRINKIPISKEDVKAQYRDLEAIRMEVKHFMYYGTKEQQALAYDMNKKMTEENNKFRDIHADDLSRAQ
jgi:hypothetical protein